MCELKPPVSLENAENERHIKYLRSDEVMQPDYDFPIVSVFSSCMTVLLEKTALTIAPSEVNRLLMYMV